MLLKIEFVQKLKSLVLILEKQWSMLFFLFYSLCQKLWESSPIVNGVPNYIDSQNDTLEALESAASHSPSTVTDEVGLVDDYKKSQENADSSDDAADDEELILLVKVKNILVEKNGNLPLKSQKSKTLHTHGCLVPNASNC